MFGAWPNRRRQRDLGIAHNLHYCACGSTHAALGEYGELDDESWFLNIRCGDCGEWRYVEVCNAHAETWERCVYDHGSVLIERLADALNDERFADDAEQFIAALNADAILPEDFS